MTTKSSGRKNRSLMVDGLCCRQAPDIQVVVQQWPYAGHKLHWQTSLRRLTTWRQKSQCISYGDVEQVFLTNQTFRTEQSMAQERQALSL